jgi:hypothetical protein
MLSFKVFISEEIKPASQQLNKKQMNSLLKHPVYKSHIHTPMHGVYARPDDHDSGPGKHTRNFVVASDGRYRLHISMTHNGKVLGHELRRKDTDDKGNTVWSYVKGADGK